MRSLFIATQRLLWIPGAVSILLALSAAASVQFTAALGSPFPVRKYPRYVAVGDFNGDGKPDLAIASFVGITVLLGNGKGGFTAAPGSPFTVGTGPDPVAVGDFNGDAKPDLAVAKQDSNDVAVLLGNGNGGFTAVAGIPFKAGTNPRSVAVGDFDGDAKPDLAIVNFVSGDVTLLLGNGAG